MKTLLVPLTFLALFLSPATRGDEPPYFSSLREQLTEQLTIASNTVPLDKKLLATLRSGLKIVDKTKPTLTAGSTALGTLAKSLGKTSLSNLFHPLITDTRAVYLETMESDLETLEARLAGTIPGNAQSSARNTLGKLSAALDGVVTNASLTLSLKSLGKSATALFTAQKAVTKAENAKPGSDFLAGTVTESNLGPAPFKSTVKTGLSAYYDDFSGEIEIDAGDLKGLGGGRMQARFLELIAAVPGEGTHTLSLTNEAYAIYQRAIVTNIRSDYPDVDVQQTYFTIDPFNRTLGSGTLVITVDFERGLVWGSFTFTTNGNEDPNLQATMTGSFLVRLEEPDYEFDAKSITNLKTNRK